MLFIKTQFGSLVNLENVTSIVVEPALGKFSVSADFSDSPSMSLFMGTEEECQEYREALFQWLPHTYDDFGSFVFKNDND